MNLRADRRLQALLVERSPDAWQLLSKAFSTLPVAALPFGLGFPIQPDPTGLGYILAASVLSRPARKGAKWTPFVQYNIPI